MQVILKDPRPPYRKWMIKPYDNGMCWMLYKQNLIPKGKLTKNKKKSANEWLFTGKYPTSLVGALESALRAMAADPEVEGEYEYPAKEVEGINRVLRKTLHELATNVELKEN